MEPDSKPTLTQRIRRALSDWYLGKEVRVDPDKPDTLGGAVFHDYYREPPSRLAKDVAWLVSSCRGLLNKLTTELISAFALMVAGVMVKWLWG